MELSVKQGTRRGGQVSRGDQDQPAEIGQTSKVRISREERLKKFREEAAEEERSSTQAQNAKPKIQRVPFMLRDHKNFEKYYEPRVAAIGPFHHGSKPKYEQAEKIKLQLAVNFVKDSKQNDEDLLKKVEEKIEDLRECYAEEATKDFDDDYLAWMLFVDGCSTLEFIYKYEMLESFEIKRDQVAFVEHDMFLLENQLPYQLLELLMISSTKYEDVKYSIERFVQMHGVAPEPQRGAQNTQPIKHVNIPVEPKPTHLLEYLLTRMLGYPPIGRSGQMPGVAPKVEPPQPEADGARNAQLSATQFLDNLLTKMREYIRRKKRETSANHPQSFRNVQELQAAGIRFRQSKEPSVLKDIYFKSFLCCGFLYLPKIKVDDSMGPKFMNLIAYEMCPDFQNDFGVTSYIGFLDSLIDYADDVKHLRKSHILRNFLGSDDEVAKLFNEIGTDLVPNTAIYYDVKRKIEDHYKTNWTKWMAQFFHEHFSSPWTILAFIGVLLGLGMTAAQTWYAANSGTPCEALLEYLKERGY
ncbi:unnamed protein product [Prunus armeniaca]|uniref:Uncharacterized protein n=1 Tax=Prunus armeniaca TaxID=36596 RepID=A0A6J5XSV8_PRUAR|nr:unnamed protein product [Prunus armeniaca]